MEIKQNIQTGEIEFVTYLGGDGYSAPVVYKKTFDTAGNAQEQMLYLHRDYQGSIIAITNDTGAVLEKRQFDAWGAILKVQDGAGNTLAGLTVLDRGYTGHEHLQSVGLINMNGRLYDPKLHRFLQPDNFVQDTSNTQNYNRYSYVLNNPVKYTDLSGERFTLSDLISAVAIVGGAILCFIPGLAVIGVPLIGAGVAHFTTTLNEFKQTGDWVSASNNAGFIVSFTAKTDWGYDSKTDVNGVNQNGQGTNNGGNSGTNGNSGGQGGNLSPAQQAQIKAREHHYFFGANVVFNAPQFGGSVYNSTSFGTIHTSSGFYSDYLKNGLDSDGGHILMHEYGHYLHAQYAPLNFYSYAFWSSGVTANFSWSNTNWTEIRANTMAYYYFGQPSYWRKNENPIDSNYLSKQEIFQLTHHSRPFNPFRP